MKSTPYTSPILTHTAIPKPLAQAIHALSLGFALATPLLSVHAMAAVEAPTSQQGGQHINIQPGSLSQALSQYAASAGVVLSFDASLTDSLTSPGLNGYYSVEEGFKHLLLHTNLVVSQQGPSTYLLHRQNSQVELSPVIIKGRTTSASAPVSGYLANLTTAGNKSGTPLLETANSVSVVTSRQIADRKALSVEEAVAYSSGVSVSNSGLDPRYDQIKIRGYAVTTDADFLDGLRQPNTGWLSYFATEPYTLEQIEVIKGPESMLFGQLSPGGLVNRISKRPGDNQKQEIQLQAGSHNHVQGQFDINGNLDEAEELRFRIVGLQRDADTDIEQVNNDIRVLSPSLSWALSPKTDLTLLTHYLERETSGSPRPYQDGDSLTHFWSGDEDFDKLDQQQWSVGYELEHRFSENLKLQQNLRYGSVDTINQYASAGARTGTLIERTSYGVYENMDMLSTDTRLNALLTTGNMEHSFTAGFDFARIDYGVEYAYGTAPDIDMSNPDYHQNIERPNTVLMDVDGKVHRKGLYLQDLISLGNWRFTAGIRHDRAEKQLSYSSGSTTRQDDSKSTYRAGALYLFPSGISTYASYATSFLPQSGTNAYGDTFLPTEGEQIEVGIKYQPEGSNTLLTAALYQLTESNRLTQDPDNSINRIQSGEVRSRGLELEAISDLNDSLSMTASYTFTDAKQTENNDGYQGKQAINTPKHLASLWLDYRFQEPTLQGLALSGGVRYIGSEYSDYANTQKNDRYSLVDLGLRYDLSGQLDGVQLGLNAKNLFDKEHIVCATGYCYRNAGRSLIGSLSYHW